MTLKHLESQLRSLTFSEKEQAIQLLTQSLGTIWTGIEKTPGISRSISVLASEIAISSGW